MSAEDIESLIWTVAQAIFLLGLAYALLRDS